MSAVVPVDRVHVLQRLRDLRDWARFIHESLKDNQPLESGKRELLQAYMGEPFLREFDSESAGLVERLEQMIEQIESSAVPAERAAILTR